MINCSPYFDLCIEEQCFSSNLETTLKTIYDYGYRTIAINQLLEEENLEPKKKKKKGEPREVDPVPEPCSKKKINKAIAKLNLNNFKVLSRLTISFSNIDSLHKIVKSPNYKKFDIIAALPTTQKGVYFLGSTFEADILTFDATNKTDLKISRKLYNVLCEKGYKFELPYSQAIQDSTKRRNLIHLSHLYHTFGKSKNIIISSGASNAFQIRSPYDIMNLGLIFGLSLLQCKNAISHCCRQTIINSVGRRHGKAIMFAENVVEDKEEEPSVIILDQSEIEDMEVDQPASKRNKV